MVQELDRKLSECAAFTAQLACLLQRGLPLLGRDAVLFRDTALPYAGNFNEPTHIRFELEPAREAEQ
jgi:hypothetical protein